MANYYYVTIKGDKMTQEVASKILQEMASKNYIRNFSFHEGYLFYNTRGLTDITSILNEAGFVDEEIEIKDEFDLAYENSMTPDESIMKDIEKIVKHIEHFKEHIEISEEMKSIENILNNIVKEHFVNA